jgi:regulator of chromosome condensation
MLPSVMKGIAHQVETEPVRTPRTQEAEIILTHAPAQRLNVYVFGGNSAGELGLGRGEGSENVALQRLNHNPAAASVGIV